MLVPAGSAPPRTRQFSGGGPAMYKQSAVPIMDSRECPSMVARRSFTYRMSPSAATVATPSRHALDEDPVRPVRSREGQDVMARPALGDQEGVDLARADGAQGFLRLGELGQGLGEVARDWFRDLGAHCGMSPEGRPPTAEAGGSPSVWATRSMADRLPVNRRAGKGAVRIRVGVARMRSASALDVWVCRSRTSST